MDAPADASSARPGSCIFAAVSYDLPPPVSGPLAPFLLAPAHHDRAYPDHDGVELRCYDVRGFAEAVTAAEDPRAPTPSRLQVVGPDDHAAAWLERWSEDVDQVRRRLTVRRDGGAEITLVATLASFGPGVPASLAVESIRPRGGGAILRSGVHPRAEVDAALAILDQADVP